MFPNQLQLQFARSQHLETNLKCHSQLWLHYLTVNQNTKNPVCSPCFTYPQGYLQESELSIVKTVALFTLQKPLSQTKMTHGTSGINFILLWQRAHYSSLSIFLGAGLEKQALFGVGNFLPAHTRKNTLSAYISAFTGKSCWSIFQDSFFSSVLYSPRTWKLCTEIIFVLPISNCQCFVT